jgi:SRSO17 transposase
MTPTLERDQSSLDTFDPQRWGLPLEAVLDLGEQLYDCWERYHDCFTSQTRDTSEWALVYLRGLLLLPAKRNYANIARRVVSHDNDGQDLQQFMSDSPWRADRVFAQIQHDITAQPVLHGGILSLDESADAKAGVHSAGAARQYNGRLGKTDVCQVGVALSYSNEAFWALVDADLYFPKHWFDDDHAKLRKQLHVPADRVFQTKPQIGLELIRRARARGLPFEVVAADAVYGRDGAFRAGLDSDGITYIADIPKDYAVYLSAPEVGVPEAVPGQRGPRPTVPRVLNGVEPVKVQSLVREDTPWEEVCVRCSERGHVRMPCWRRRVWVVNGTEVRQEWLLLHRETDGQIRYCLSNASVDTPLATLAGWRAGRYFVERTFQDSKSELGWDELVARKYWAWLHHTALDALALWFLGWVRLQWAQKHPRDERLAEELGVEQLPELSVANMRELLAAVIPLRQLTPQEAIEVVVRHFNNRARSTRTRLQQEAARRNHSPEELAASPQPP